MRGLIEGLPSPHPLGAALPTLYLEDDLAQRLTQALDVVIAPVFNVLDNFDAYLDARLCPADFLPWLGVWAGIAFDEGWSESHRRSLLAAGAELQACSGTRRGLLRAVGLLTGVEPEIDDPGGVRWSAKPDAPPPEVRSTQITVRVRGADAGRVDTAALERVVAAATPAHLVPVVEVGPA